MNSYCCARYYDPALGRFINEDPLSFDGSTNFYGYSAANPVNYVDPSGLKADPIWEATWQVIEGGAKKKGGNLLARILQIGGTSAEVLIYLAAPGTGGSNWATSHEAQFESECRERQKRCGKDLIDLYEVMDNIKLRYYEMMTDREGIFQTAFSQVNPAKPWAGTWVGHQHQFEGRQRQLRNLIDKLRKNGCPIPPEAELLEALPTPKFPGWKK